MLSDTSRMTDHTHFHDAQRMYSGRHNPHVQNTLHSGLIHREPELDIDTACMTHTALLLEHEFDTM